MSFKPFNNPNTDKVTDMYAEPLECVNCHEKFGVTQHQYNTDDKHCGNCYFYKYGLEEYQGQIKRLLPIQNMLWHTPLNQIPKDILEQLDFVGGQP